LFLMRPLRSRWLDGRWSAAMLTKRSGEFMRGRSKVDHTPMRHPQRCGNFSHRTPTCRKERSFRIKFS
jgi:hypothetical protein